MGVVDHHVVVAEGTHPAWTALDDALQVLVRAESLVMLLGCAFDVEEHHRYCAEVACDHLQSVKDKISEAQALVRAGEPPPLEGDNGD